MCGRFAFNPSKVDLKTFFDIGRVDTPPETSYNIAPTQPVWAVVQRDGVNTLERMHWGLIPAWAKDPKIGSKMINARAETLGEKPTFKRLLKSQRCLILADGFYEWRESGTKRKTPLFICLESRQPFAFAGLYDTWTSSGGEPMNSCTIITTTPNELMAAFHHRMPVILAKKDQKVWLDPSFQDSANLLGLLKPYPAEEMVAYEVSNQVNSPKNNSAALIQAVM